MAIGLSVRAQTEPILPKEIEEAMKEIASYSQLKCLSGDCTNGFGSHISPRAKYVGEFELGLPHGSGTAFWADGLMITGSFKDGLAVWGDVAKSNGEKYRGQIKNNFYHGEGTLVYLSGEVITGWFEKGKYIGVSPPPSKSKLRNMDYDSYLLTDHWKKVKNLALKHYGEKCAICGERGFYSPIQVHHKSYKNRGYEEEHLEDL